MLRHAEKKGTRHMSNAPLAPELCTHTKGYTTLRLADQCAYFAHAFDPQQWFATA